MGAIFGFFFLIIIIVLIFGLSIISGILRLLFGFGRKSSSQHTQSRNQQNTYHQEDKKEDAGNTPSSRNHKKLFDKDEGEYVDFEEVKDDDK